MKRQNPKKITSQQITGQQGVNFVERIVLEMKFTWHPTNAGLDAGIDGIIEIIDPETGEATNCILQVQVKATTKKWTYETAETFTYQCDPRDIEYWMRGNTPVILVVVRPEGEEAYWANIKECFADPNKRKDPYVKFDKKLQRFDAEAARSLMRLAVAKDVGPYLPATPCNEDLYSNLLHVASYPTNVYVAATQHRDPKAIVDWAKAKDVHLPGGWILTEKGIRCFHNLREGPWREICDVGTVEAMGTDEWADSDDPDRQREFVRLLNQAFRADMRLRHLWYSKVDNCFFFPPLFTPTGEVRSEPRRYNYLSIRQSASSEVVMIHCRPDTKNIVYWRHDAFKYAFLRIRNAWHLAITPHYLFTTDGRAPYPYSEELLSGLKRLERQKAILGQVVMWKHKLTFNPTADLFDRNTRRDSTLIVFDNLLTARCGRGIRDSEWLPGDGAVDVANVTSGELEKEDGGLFG